MLSISQIDRIEDQTSRTILSMTLFLGCWTEKGRLSLNVRQYPVAALVDGLENKLSIFFLSSS